MRSEMRLPQGLIPAMEEDIFNYGIHMTEYIAGTIHYFLITGAFANEIFLHADVRMK